MSAAERCRSSQGYPVRRRISGLLLLLAMGCGSPLHGGTSRDASDSSGVGGSGFGGGSGGVALAGGAGAGGAPAESGGRSGMGGTPPSGGRTGSGGLTSGGAGGTGAAAGGSSGSVFGMACTTSQDCPADAICCDGSDPTCDGTRLPSGDGGTPGEFIVSADGLTATDTITGLLWQIDDVGPRPGCTGTPPTEDYCRWEEARAYCASLVSAGTSGWRVPAPIELLTAFDLIAVNGVANPNGFPGTVNNDWTSDSSTSHKGTPTGHGLYFDGYYDRAMYCSAVPMHPVRCVRGSRCYPKSRFVPLDYGLVRDALTGLVWQQQGSTANMTWANAQSYCSSFGTGFRLPTFRELVSLLWLPSGVATPFSGGTSGPFWTSSPDGGPSVESSGRALFGDVLRPEAISCESANRSSDAVSATFAVRCVR
jgi:hypothetical protein